MKAAANSVPDPFPFKGWKIRCFWIKHKKVNLFPFFYRKKFNCSMDQLDAVDLLQMADLSREEYQESQNSICQKKLPKELMPGVF
jgi:hypothetical protein